MVLLLFFYNCSCCTPTTGLLYKSLIHWKVYLNPIAIGVWAFLHPIQLCCITILARISSTVSLLLLFLQVTKAARCLNYCFFFLSLAAILLRDFFHLTGECVHSFWFSAFTRNDFYDFTEILRFIYLVFWILFLLLLICINKMVRLTFCQKKLFIFLLLIN